MVLIILVNSAQVGGAIVTVGNVAFIFHGNNVFFNNSANDGGVPFAGSNTLLSFSGTNEFSHNSAQYGGAIYTEYNVVFTFNGTNNFINNSAESDGAIDTLGKLSLPSVELTTLSTTQQTMVVQSMQKSTYHCIRLQLFADSFRDHQVKCVSHTPAMPLIMHLDYAEFTQTLIHVK